jgi:hypothetical protein
MTENAVKEQGTPAPADLTGADHQAQQLIQHLQLMLRELTGWRVWASDSGALYATRTTDLTKDEMSDGLEMTVAADDPRDLLEQIREQLRKSARRATAEAAPSS